MLIKYVLAMMLTMSAVSMQVHAFTDTVPVQQWVPTAQTFKLVGVGDRQFMPYMTGDSQRIWALTSTPDQRTLRFEVRKGDVNPYDFSVAGMTKERSEIGTIQRFPEGVPVHISYKLRIQQTGKAESWWGTVFGQMHQDGVTQSPPMAFHMDKDNLLSIALTNGRTPSFKSNLITIDPSKQYAFDIYFLGGNEGSVIVYINGARVFGYSGIVGQAKGGLYWKIGVYRAASTPTVVASYSDLKIESGDMVSMEAQDTLAMPKIRVNRTGFISDIAVLNVPQDAKITLFDNGKSIGTGNATMYRNFNFKIKLDPGIHHITARYRTDLASSNTANTVVIGVGTGQSILDMFDTLNAAKGLTGILITDGKIIEIPANTNFLTFLAKNQNVVSVLPADTQFVKFALARTRADFYDKSGQKLRSEKVAQSPVK